MSSKRESLGDRIFLFFVWFIVIFLFLVVLYPLILVLSNSLSSATLVATGRIWLFPREFTIMGYQRVFQDPAIMRGYANTIFYTFFGTAINLAVTVPVGYSLSKKTLPGRKFLTFYFLLIMYFSGGMIPTFLLVRNLRLYDTRTVLLVLGAFGAYNSIICRAFFASIPQELEDAAEIDGCTPIRTFFQVALPVSQALIGVMTLFFAVGHWNSFFNAMIYTINPMITPLQLVLRRILVLEEASAAMIADHDIEFMLERFYIRELIKYAVIVVSSLPLLLLYPFLQKYFVKGVMIGSLKG